MNIQLGDCFDAIVVGAGPAGLSAVLLLGRSRRRILVIDAGKPRNAVSHAANTFFSRDGIEPSELLQIGREQLHKYDGVKFHTGEVIDAHHLATASTETLNGVFQVTLNNGDRVVSRKLLLATGVKDILPEIEGFAELWGTSVFHCPYCHGWEVQDQPLAICGNGDIGFEMALMLIGWSRDLILCSDGAATLSDEQRQQLSHWNIRLYEAKIARLEHENGLLTAIVLANGQVIARQGIFLHPQIQQHSDLAQKLGCALTENGLVQVAEDKQTSVPGLYAAGDTSSLVAQIGLAATNGGTAAVFMNRALIRENLALHNG